MEQWALALVTAAALVAGIAIAFGALR